MSFLVTVDLKILVEPESSFNILTVESIKHWSCNGRMNQEQNDDNGLNYSSLYALVFRKSLTFILSGLSNLFLL